MASVSKEAAAAPSLDSFTATREPFPRSPASISPTSSRRDSLRNASERRDRSSEPRARNSPPMRLTRKRAASLNTDAANRIGDLALDSAKLEPVQTAREQVCLCQPDPKIPRPRNAFILYRQHYQASVVAAHPGLANPEISKIIGEQWRDQPLAIKNEWKRLAEEEKQRHQRQYPDYRYQPRRAGKPVQKAGVIEGDNGRCAKCNGRFISTPATPLTPFTPSYSHSSNNGHLQAFSVSHRYSDNFAMSTPRMMPPHQNDFRHQRAPYDGPMVNTVPQGAVHRGRHDDEMEGSSPDSKRRRIHEEPRSPRGYVPQSHYGPPPGMQHQQTHSDMGGRGLISGSWSEDRRQMPLPSPLQLMQPYQHQQTGGMEPPPRPSPIMSYPVPVRSQAHPSNALLQVQGNAFDESLRLPPLQTSLASSSLRPDLAPPSARLEQARSVKAMVMTIPFLNKIKVLSKISAPLDQPGVGSPLHEVRGGVIAVEGPDAKAVAEVGRYLEASLSKDDEVLVKSWSEDAQTNGDVAMPDGIGENETFDRYLTIVQEWHKKGKEIAVFITTPPPPPLSSLLNESSTSHVMDTPISPTNTTSSSSTLVPANASLSKSRIPIALLPNGFSLTTSDRYASQIPINDAYAPVDHWQWAATLFRGIVGPDLTIYVPGGREEDRQGPLAGGIDVRRDCAAIVVNGTEEKDMRRLVFEVLEFVRGLSGHAGNGSEGRSV